MFSQRSPLDLVFFSGAFLAIESFVSFQWYNFFFYGGTEIDNGIPVTIVQVVILLVGIILMSASVVFRRYFAVKENDVSESVFPSTRLFADFAFIAGSFIGVADLSYFSGIFSGGYLQPAMALFLLFISPILLGTSFYLWYRQRRSRSGVLGNHRLACEIFSAVWISILLVILFVPFGGILFFPEDITYSYTPFAIVISSVAMIIAGSYAFSNEERKIVSSIGFGQSTGGNVSVHSFKKLFLAIFLVALVAASGLTVLTNDFGYAYSGCGGGFGLYSCNVRTITVSSLTLYGGSAASGTQPATSSISLGLNNPGAATTITSLSLMPSASFSSPNYSQSQPWSTTSYSGDYINFSAPYTMGSANSVNAGSVNTYVFYPVSKSGSASEEIIANQTYNYVINFANGQSVSGSLIAQ